MIDFGKALFLKRSSNDDCASNPPMAATLQGPARIAPFQKFNSKPKPNRNDLPVNCAHCKRHVPPTGDAHRRWSYYVQHFTSPNGC